MESSLEKKQRVNLLMDCYSDLLTEKQQTYLEYYYQEDYSYRKLHKFWMLVVMLYLII